METEESGEDEEIETRNKMTYTELEDYLLECAREEAYLKENWEELSK